MMRLGAILRKARGKDSRVQFARKLELSYTFVRAMEHGLRFPSDKVLLEIADRLDEDAEELFLAAYCDRSPHLAGVLKGRGLAIPENDEEEPKAPLPRASAPAGTVHPQASPISAPTAQVIRAQDPF